MGGGIFIWDELCECVPLLLMREAVLIAQDEVAELVLKYIKG